MLELLAPVGNIEALKSAIYSGADAVYLGMSKFNARQKAENFNKDNIKDVVELCHLNNVKVFITFNTLIKDEEFNDFEELVDVCVKANVDAFIVTDLGTLDIFKKYDIPIHASTQMGIHNYEGAKIAKELGFSRVVLSRETTKEDILKIKTLGIEIEYFVHGALCVSFSGGCLLSSFLSGDSGNRGLCKQPCRLKYFSSLSNKEEYFLSPSDQCLIEHVKELEEMGIYSLKIEGRLKSSQYVGEVVKQYRAAIDNNLNKNYLSQLKKAYNRGNFTQGYLYDDTKDLMSSKVQGNIGEYIGDIVNIKNKTLIIKSKRGIFLKDGFKIFNNDVEIGGFMVDNVKLINGFYYVNTIKSYPIGSKLYLTLDSEMVNRYKNIDLSNPISIEYECIFGKNFKLKAKYNEICVEKSFDLVECAVNKSILKEDVEEKLSEINGSGFYVKTIFGQISQNSFYPLSKIKNAKREIINLLKEKILKEYNLKKQRIIYEKNELNCLNCNVNNTLIEIDNLNKIPKNACNYEYVLNINECFNNGDNIIKNQINYNNIETIWLKLPKICRYADMLVLDNFIKNNEKYIKGFLIENIYGIEIAKKYNKPLILGTSMNILNSKVMHILGIDNAILSLECSKSNLNKKMFTYIYGPIVLMSFVHCPIKLNTGCSCSNCKYKGDFVYSNKNKTYLVHRNKIAYCYFDLINKDKIDLIEDKIDSKHYINASKMSIEDISKLILCLEKNVSFSKNAYKGHLYLKIR